MNIYDSETLMGIFNSTPKAPAFLRNLLFSNTILFPTDNVYFERTQRSRRSAPLSSKMLPATAEKLRCHDSVSLTPPHLKMKGVVNPSDVLKRRPGESFASDLNLQERFDASIAEMLVLFNAAMVRAEEKMIAEILSTGVVTIRGEDAQAIHVDFDRDRSLAVNTSWKKNDPREQLTDWRCQVQNKSGFVPDVAVMDPGAFKMFLDSLSADGCKNFLANLKVDESAGTASGVLDGMTIYSHQNFYMDDAGTMQGIIPENSVFLASREGCGGTMLYGAVQSMMEMVSVERFPFMWEETDPHALVLMMQSNPLPVLGWANATLFAKVA